MDEQYMNEQEPQSWGESVRKNTNEQVYGLPFADSVYEMPHEPVYVQPVKRPKKNSKAGRVILCVVLAVLLVASASGVTALLLNGYWEMRMSNLTMAMNDKNAAMQAQIDALSRGNGNSNGGTISVAGQMTPGQVYAQNVDAVVAVECAVQDYDMFGQAEIYDSFGSGFIISADGYVVSNYHVVQGASKIDIAMASGQVHEAVLVGFDETNDVALLKVDAQGLPFAVLGSSSALAVGDQVVAIGNPLGELTSTLTVGYISAKDRVVATDGSTLNTIQTDAAINSGNSGGPLFNMQGEVVGITTAKYSGTSSSGATIEGIGFAIPMDDVIGIIEDLRDFGYVTGAYIGVMVRDVDPTAQAYGLPAGAYVEEVTPGYAAEAAKLRVGDIIVDLGGYKVTSVTELTRMLRRFEPGETVSITVYRNGQEIQLSITLDEKPRADAAPDILMPGDEGFEEWYEDFIEDYVG